MYLKINNMDFNKITATIKYAIGEIIIISIGLVIALQVTNWSEELNNEKIAANYLNKINSDIDVDIESLSLLINQRSEELKMCDSMISYFKKKKVSNKKIFEKGFFAIFIEKGFSPNKVAFNSLLNSGYLKNLNQSSVEEKLNLYYSNADNVIFVEKKFNDSTQYVEELLKEKGFSIEFEEAFKWNNLDTINFTYKKIKKYPDLYSHLIHSRVFLKELIELYQDLQKKGREVKLGIGIDLHQTSEALTQ